MAVADLLMTGARILYSNTGVSLPSETSIAYGASWTSFTELGILLEELRVNYRPILTGISPQNALGNVKAYRTNEVLTAEGLLGDFTGANLALLTGGTNTTTAAGGAQKPYYNIVFGGQPAVTNKQWGFEGFRLDSSGNQQPIRFFIFNGSIRMNGPMRLNKEGKLGLPFIIEGYHDPTLTVGQQLGRIHIVTGPTS
ncbi:MAG: hypothetical protein E6Q97_15980 [Desulfurellales bacterium]|nr:MAG: hypothetical protein E6Q97_15980 [Desulfurellales bacterium]